jgi:succinate dehydrogenase hydrophobic anchor subunit
MSSRAIHPGLTFEYLMWLFTRVSAVALLTLAAVGMIAAFILGARTQMDLPTLMRWTFFPNPNHVISSDIPDITLGWANGFWQVMEILFVTFGVTHGFNGLRIVAEDFFAHSFLRPMMRGLVFFLWMFVLLMAIYVILSS